MATIKIRRSSEYINKMRAIKILVDGKEIGSIADGETKEFTTAEGQHKIEAKIDWCGSPELSFNIKDTEIKYLTVGGYKNSTLIISAALILSVIHFVLFFGFNINYTAFLFAPLLLMMLYYVTLGRKKYLSLNENNSGNR